MRRSYPNFLFFLFYSTNEKIDAVDGSLKRLKTDRIDLLQTHWPARYSPQSNWGQSLQYRREMQGAYGMNFADFDEITQTMGDLVEQGKIRGYGFCNDNAVGLVGCAEAAKRLGVAPYVIMLACILACLLAFYCPSGCGEPLVASVASMLDEAL